jgi:putative aldouronate transport system permease protein
MRKLEKKYKPFWQLYIFLLLPVIYVVLFRYVPMAGVQLAFRDYDILGGIWNSEWVGMENFTKFFNSYQFERVITNTLRLSIYSIAIGFPFPIIFALLLNTITNLKFKKIVQTITYMPHFISIVVLVGMLVQVFNINQGLYGRLHMLFTGVKATDLFASTSGFTNLYIWSGVWQDFGWSSILYLAALTAVSPELHEAAEIDGATRLQRIFHVDLPALLPTIIIMLILRTGSVMNVGFEKVYLMQNDLNIAASEVISTYEYKRGLASGNTDFSLATAIGLFNSSINLVLLLIVNTISSKVNETSLW